MSMWWRLSAIFNYRQILRHAGFAVILVVFITALFNGAPTHAAPGINQTVAFQARLMTANGSIVPDGYYNVQFKIYQDGTGAAANNPDGTLKWTESYVNNNGTNGIQVRNGLMSVALGSRTPFGSSVDWNQDTIWLSMNIAGSAQTCTTFGTGSCTADGEMLPMKRITSVPFALNAGMLGGKTADDFLQNTASLQTGSLQLTGSLQSNTSILAPSVDTATAGSLSLGTTNATSITLEKDTATATGKSLTANGTVAVKTDSATAFSIQNTLGSTMMNVDTVNANTLFNTDITIGSTATIAAATGDIATSGDITASGAMQSGSVATSILNVSGAATFQGSLSTSAISAYAGTTSTNTTWVERTSSQAQPWRAIANSSDGTKLVAIVYGGHIWTSSSSGAVWAEHAATGNQNWNAVASSADGTKLAAAVWGGNIWTSSNGGTSWTEQTGSGTRNWARIASDSTGTKLIASDYGGYLYTSSDSGVNWTARTGPGTQNWKAVTSSADGTKLVAGIENGYLYTSADSGANWTQQTSAGTHDWVSIASSSDSTKLAAAAWNGSIWTSADSGTTWTEQTNSGAKQWSSITSSSDGTKLAAVGTNWDATAGVYQGYVSISTDSGASWVSDGGAGVREWISIASSADGTKLVAVPENGYVYTKSSSTSAALAIGADSATNISLGDANSATTIRSNTTTVATTSTSAFTIQNAGGSKLFNANTQDNRVEIGTSDTTGTLLVLDTKTNAGDPTGVNGAMYYNRDAGKFRCFENNAWKDCITALPVSSIATTDTANSTTTPADVTGLSFTLAAHTKYYYKYVIIHQSANATTGIGFGVTTPTSLASSNWCVNTTGTLTANTAGLSGSYCGTGDASSTTTGVQTANTSYTSTMEGYIETGNDPGTLQLRAKSAVSAETTVKTGSFGILQVVQ